MDVNRAEKFTDFEAANNNHGHSGQTMISITTNKSILSATASSSTPSPVPRSSDLLPCWPSLFPQASRQPTTEAPRRNATSPLSEPSAWPFPVKRLPRNAAPAPPPGDIIVDPYPIAIQSDTDAVYPEETNVTDELVGAAGDADGSDDDYDEDGTAENDGKILAGGAA
ncbi:hypothetical protein BGZ47_009896 [Haplosporangium gracile]|nr:hypothetical protein BGZ47_009896 [Haplosporangium gracile]